MNNNIDKYIKEILSKELYVPNHYTNAIKEALYKKEKKKNIKNKKIYRYIVAIASCIILVFGSVFAKDIVKNIKSFFNMNEGIDTAIKNNYIEEINMEYINSNKTKLKIDYMLMDDYNLNLSFCIKIEDDKIKINDITQISFSNMIITDEEHKILYCNDKDRFNEYCKNNNLQLTFNEFNEKYINSEINYYIKNKNQENQEINVVYNLASEMYPKSKKLYVEISQISVEKENTSVKINGDWKIQIDVPDIFYNRENMIYKVKNCSNSNINVTSAVINDTCLKIELMTEEEGIYEDSDSDELKEEKIKEYVNSIIKERELGNGIEPIFTDMYVENEKGEKFYPIRSNSEDEGYNKTFTGNIKFWQTFSLTKYDATNIVKVYLTYKEENIEIELERK